MKIPTETQKEKGSVGDAQLVKAISKQKKVNQSLEKGRKDQWERRRDHASSCQQKSARPEAERWSQHLTEQLLCKGFSLENSTESASRSP